MKCKSFENFKPFSFPGNRAKENYQVYHTKDGMKRFASLVDIYRSMTSYRKHVMRENRNWGIPMARPLFLHYETDPVCYTLEHQFMFGRDILVQERSRYYFLLSSVVFSFLLPCFFPSPPSCFLSFLLFSFPPILLVFHFFYSFFSFFPSSFVFFLPFSFFIFIFLLFLLSLFHSFFLSFLLSFYPFFFLSLFLSLFLFFLSFFPSSFNSSLVLTT